MFADGKYFGILISFSFFSHVPLGKLPIVFFPRYVVKSTSQKLFPPIRTIKYSEFIGCLSRIHRFKYLYDVLQVLTTEVFADMTSRLFRIHRYGHSGSRLVHHLQYHWWTVGGVPLHTIPFLQYIRKVYLKTLLAVIALSAVQSSTRTFFSQCYFVH